MSICDTRIPMRRPPCAEFSMTIKLCDVNPAAVDKLPQYTGDKSGIGVHFVDAYLKPMNVKLDDGTRVKCKRRGLKITLVVGERQGHGLMRRLAVGPDPEAMLAAALQEAAAEAGVALAFDNGVILLSYDAAVES
jgi:hypothetical protein